MISEPLCSGETLYDTFTALHRAVQLLRSLTHPYPRSVQPCGPEQARYCFVIPSQEPVDFRHSSAFLSTAGAAGDAACLGNSLDPHCVAVVLRVAWLGDACIAVAEILRTLHPTWGAGGLAAVRNWAYSLQRLSVMCL